MRTAVREDTAIFHVFRTREYNMLYVNKIPPPNGEFMAVIFLRNENNCVILQLQSISSQEIGKFSMLGKERKILSGIGKTPSIVVNITPSNTKYRLLKPEEIVSYGFCTGDGFSGGGAYSAEYALEYAFDQNSTTAFMGDGSANYDYGIDEAIYVNFASAMQIHSIIFVNQTLATGWDTSYCPWYLSIGWAPYSESNFNWYIEYTQEGNLFEYNINRNISTVYIDYNMYDDYLSGFADVYFTVPDEE